MGGEIPLLHTEDYMANDLTENPWVLDSDGILSTGPVCVKWARLLPAAVGAVATLKRWNEIDTRSTASGATCTVTGANTIASTGNFTAAKVVVGDAIEITSSSTGNNLGIYLVKTRSDDNTIVTDDGGLTNDTGATYNFKIYTGITVFPFLVSEDSIVPDDFMPTEPMRLGNLSLDGLTSGAILYIYV